MKISTEIMTGITISRFRRMESVVDLDPPYQREGGVWKDETRSVLIDSIINGLDVPKLYFEVPTPPRKGPRGLSYQYAVIDGKQRLGAILDFLWDRLSLPDDFRYFEDKSVAAGRMTLSNLEKTYPLLARRFLDFELPIVRVVSDTGDLIEEMFQRLNASSSLNAAERRNSVLGPTRDAANALANHQLLVSCSPIRSARYKYRELGAKFLAIEHQIATRGKLADTKAATLYELFTATRGTNPKIAPESMLEYRQSATTVLDRMAGVFVEDDRLLASIGTVVVFYLTFRNSNFADKVNRELLADFEHQRREAAHMRDDDPEYDRMANIRLREYNGLVQSTNDGTALTRRSEILESFVFGYRSDDPLAGLDRISEGDVPAHDDDVS